MGKCGLSTDIETDERMKMDFGHAGGGAGEGWASTGYQLNIGL